LNDFQTPNQDPGSERRLLLTFALTFVVIFITQQFISKYYKPAAPPQRQEQTQNTTQPSSAQSGSPQQPTTPAPAGKSPASRSKSPAPAISTKQAATESETVIENDLYRITFSNRGGVAKSWVLKKYKDDKGHPLELVNSIRAAVWISPLVLRL